MVITVVVTIVVVVEGFIVELTKVEVTSVDTKVDVCSYVVTMVEEVTVVDWVVKIKVGSRVVVGRDELTVVKVDSVVGALVVELTKMVVEEVGGTVEVDGSKVGDSLTDDVDGCNIVGVVVKGV